MHDVISIRGAKEHNLKNVSVDIPKHKFVVITGLSGSGKSSLAFDTLYAEGQRRYVESLSSYARQFLNIQDKPDVESIDGLSPAIAIDQKTTSRNPRSTVGTVTEIYDYLRLLYARIGIPYSPATGLPIESQTISQMVDIILALPVGTKLHLLAPFVRGRKGEHSKEIAALQKRGFTRLRVNGSMHTFDDAPKLDKNKKHDLEVVVDRLVIKEEMGNRVADSLETALNISEGLAFIEIVSVPEITSPTGRGRSAKGVSGEGPHPTPLPRGEGVKAGDIITLSAKFACPESGFTLDEIEPRMFSFNSPFGACPVCDGLGSQSYFDADMVVPDTTKSLHDAAIAPWSNAQTKYFVQTLDALSRHFKFSLHVPFRDLPESVQDVILHGSGDEPVKITYADGPRTYNSNKPFEGVIPSLQRRWRETDSAWMREELEKFQKMTDCEACDGYRLRPEALCVKVGGSNIGQVCKLPIDESMRWFETLNDKLNSQHQKIAEKILKEIHERLGFLNNVGLDYLTLSRESGTLSGGESQRIRLASQIGSGLSGVLYVLDEPSIGLHQCDNERLLGTLQRLRDLGNTVIVVEHDEDTMRHADWLIDMGPGAGIHGGQIVSQGTAETVANDRTSITGDYLSGRREIAVPTERRQLSKNRRLRLTGCTANNLQNIDVDIPLGVMTCVSGVSGGGKSSLVIETFFKAASRRIMGSKEQPGPHTALTGLEYIDKVIEIDQSPIGRTPRSNPATYTGAFAPIRDWFTALPESKARGYKPGRFSFNVKGGRCEACQGDGLIKIEMHFLPDVYVMCDVCKGKRYNRETLEVHYKGKSIADVLDMTVDEAVDFFTATPSIREKMVALQEVGLGYIKLGQSATTLSGGEAQRIKLAKELSRRATGRTLYILDEPTTGLHSEDIRKLLQVLHTLVDAGNTMVIIEHNLDVIKTSDWVIDIGPGGGNKGGMVVAQGTPEEVAATKASVTGRYLAPLLAKHTGTSTAKPAKASAPPTKAKRTKAA
ncbi:MAG: excinuclease ABC subunit UvrA [Rickettsiales bacterium]|nr:excinuclease ABC subunit UvrA [Rickettsiales bacterium]